MSHNYYKILGVETYAGPTEIKRAYRRLAFKYHPDRNTEEKAKEFFQLLNEAYATLSDVIRKADYDRKNNFNTEEARQTHFHRNRKSRRSYNPEFFQTENPVRDVKANMPPAFVRTALFTTGLIFGLFMVVFPILQTIEHTFSPTIVFIFLGFILTVDSIAGLTGYRTMIFFELFRMMKSRFKVDLQK